MTPLDRFTAALEEHGRQGRGVMWQCPAHEDGRASLSITEKPDRLLVCCQAGCDTLDVLDALGLGWTDLFNEPAAGKGWRTNTLRSLGARANGDGRVDLGGVRYLPGAGAEESKTLAAKGSKRDLWPAPESITGEVLYVVEGEPDAVTAAEIGLLAVGVPGVKGWKPDYAARIAHGRTRVVVIADSDAPGRDAANAWAAAIGEHCQDVRVLDLAPGRTDGYDLGDFCARDATDDDRVAARRVSNARPGSRPT